MVSIFVPVSHLQAHAMVAGALHSGAAHAATPALLQAHDLSAAMSEEADYTALAYAGVRALLEMAGPVRLVLAADVDADQAEDEGGTFGEITVSELRWNQVSALFADETASCKVIAEARVLAAGLTLAAAIDSEAIESLLDRCDLLWFSPDELAELPRPDLS
jgi:hypothetical protein